LLARLDLGLGPSHFEEVRDRPQPLPIGVCYQRLNPADQIIRPAQWNLRHSGRRSDATDHDPFPVSISVFTGQPIVQVLVCGVGRLRRRALVQRHWPAYKASSDCRSGSRVAELDPQQAGRAQHRSDLGVDLPFRDPSLNLAKS
jgi:hypothetical protein